MKASHRLVLGLVVLLAAFGGGQTAQAASSELFFSEYIEGSATNKALEIYNDTGATVNLLAQGYNVQMYFNGSAGAGLTINLTGSVAAGDVYVLAQPTANAAILAQTDQTQGSGWYNGDDAVVLRKGTTVIDVIGQIGFDPGSEWGTGLQSTADNTLRRKILIVAGDPTGSDPFVPANEWDGYATDNSVGLGAHPGLPPDPAPVVSNTTPANGATGVGLNTPVTITFSEPVNLAPVWHSLECSSTGVKTTTVSGGPTTFTVQPTTSYAGGEDCTFRVLAGAVTDQDTNDPYDAMVTDFTTGFATSDADPCVSTITSIPAIQGSGPNAAITGNVRTRGVVVGDYEGDQPALRGFYLQAQTGDGNPATSDGIFVFGGTNDSVSLGQLVTVSGSAGEFQGQTQINAGQVTVCGTGTHTVAPTDVTLPFAAADAAERYEGMLVRMAQTLYVTEHFELGRFGQIVMSSAERLYQPTSLFAPGADADALQIANDLNQLLVDDPTQDQNHDPILFGRGGSPLTAANTLRGGDTVSGMIGVLTYTWGGNSASPNAYRLRPAGAMGGGVPNFQAANPRPAGSPQVGGTLKVVGMNLLNFFNTFSGCTFGVGGAPADCRGAESSTEFARQWPKSIDAVIGTGGDIIGLGEVENDGYGSDSALQFLIDRLNEVAGPGTYAFVDADAGTGQTNALGTDAIKVGMLYKPAKVTPIGTTAALNTVDFVNGGDDFPRSRPALAQAFRQNATGAKLVVSANHLKSKGSACNDPDAGDGQGNCSIVRTNAARLLGQWLNGDPTGTRAANILIVGDLNSYAKEDPIAALEDEGYTNLVSSKLGPKAYSYVFDGQWGYLDHALGNDAILPDVTGIAEWHINADEPNVLDYNTNFKPAPQHVSLYAPDRYRMSDHDPVVIGLNLLSFTTLCTLTQEYVSKPGVANALCAKLAAAEAKADRTEQEADLHAYVNQVEAQAGKALTAEQAATLIGLAGRL